MSPIPWLGKPEVSRRVDSARELSTRSSAESDLIGGFLCVIPGDASLDQLLRDPRQLPRVTIGIPLVGTGSNRANVPVPYKVNFAVLDGLAGVLACGHRRMQAVGDLGVVDANLRADVRTEELLAAPSLGTKRPARTSRAHLIIPTDGRSTDASLV